MAATPSVVGSVSNAGLNGPSTVVYDAANSHAIVAWSNGVTVVDVASPSSPSVVGGYNIGVGPSGGFRDVLYHDGYAYAAGAGRFIAVDLSNRASPSLADTLTNSLDGAWGVALDAANDRVFVVRSGGILAVDISDPTDLGTQNRNLSAISGPAHCVYDDGLLYVANRLTDELLIVDVSDLANTSNWVVVGSVADATDLDNPRGVVVHDGLCYVAAVNSDALTVIDVSTPASPSIVGSVSHADLDSPLQFALDVDNAVCYVASQAADRITVVDVAVPASPTVVGSTTHADLDSARAVAYDPANRRLYATSFGRLVVLAINQPPLAPTVTNPAAGQTLPRGETNRIAADFNDPDPGDSSSRFVGEVRLAGETDPYYTWDDETPNRFHDIAANELTLGNNELQCWYHDAAGAEGAKSDWVPFKVADRAGPPTIVDPTPGSTIGAQQATVVWSAAAQEAYRGRKREDNAGVPGDVIAGSDTGIVQSSGARSRLFTFPTNNVHEWVEIARRVDGLWSTYAQARYEIAFTPPATPTVTVVAGDGLLTVQASHPTPVGDEPSVTQMHVWRRTADASPSEDPQTPKGEGRRLAAGYGLAPSTTFDDRSVGSGIIYEYRIEAVGSTGLVSFSDWTG